MTTETKNKRGRKALPDKMKCKPVHIVLKPQIIKKLTQDANSGKADSYTKMAVKIIERYYRKRDKGITK
jgi:hypothetical protein